MVNIAEPVMFELKGDEDTKEAQQSTKGVGNLLNMDTFSTLRHLRNKLSRFVPSSPTWTVQVSSPEQTWAAKPRSLQLVWCVVQSVCLARPSPERKLLFRDRERNMCSTREHVSPQKNTCLYKSIRSLRRERQMPRPRCVSKTLQHDKWGAGGKCGWKHVFRLHVRKAVCSWATCLFVWRPFF